MDWIELIVHTTTAGSDWVSDCLMELGASGTMIEDNADIPDPSKPHGIWEIIDPKLLETMPEDVLVHAWFAPDETFPGILQQLKERLDAMRPQQPLYGALVADTRTVNAIGSGSMSAPDALERPNRHTPATTSRPRTGSPRGMSSRSGA